MQYMLGLFSLIVALVGIGIAQTALTLGIMFAMHKYIPEKLPEKNYGEFDFDAYDKNLLQNFVIKLLILIAGVTLLLHVLEYLVIYRNIIRHWGLYRMMLFVLETAAIAGGLFFLFKLDRTRLLILTGANAIIYLFFQWLLVWSNLLI